MPITRNQAFSLTDAKLLIMQAAGSRFGLLLFTTDFDRARAQLHKAKADLEKEFGITGVSIRRWPEESANLALVKTGQLPRATPTDYVNSDEEASLLP